MDDEFGIEKRFFVSDSGIFWGLTLPVLVKHDDTFDALIKRCVKKILMFTHQHNLLGLADRAKTTDFHIHSHSSIEAILDTPEGEPFYLCSTSHS